MKSITSLLVVLAMAILSGCAGVDSVNQLIAQTNADNKKFAAEALVKCGNDAACKVGVMAIFFTNNGQQFFKPDTAVDYIRVGLPVLDTLLRGYGMFLNYGGRDSNGGLMLIGNNNHVSGVNNKLTGNGDGDVTASFNATSSVDQSRKYEYNNSYNTDNSQGHNQN